MLRAEQREHIDRVVQIAASGIGKEDDPFRRSWARCVNEYGLDPTRPTPAHIVEQSLLREHREQMEEFMGVARAGMEQLYKRVSGLGYVLLLTDSTGITVDYIGNEQWDRDLRRAGLYLGADWNEQRAGTCGVGTCITERVPLTCHRDDHFDANHISLTCTAAPLFSPEGDFMGVLDVSALSSPGGKDSQQLAFHLTVLYAQMVEASNFLRHFQRYWVMRLGPTWGLVDVSGEMLVAFDRDGRIVGANSYARKGITLPDENGGSGQIVGRSVVDVFEVDLNRIWQLARNGSANEKSALKARESDELYYATIVSPRILIHPQTSTESRDLESKSISVELTALDRLSENDRQMSRIIDQCKRLVNKKVNILLHGETGTGKEVMAKALHQSSNRRDKPFIAVNCAAIPESLIESELFGYTSGSFTGGRTKGKKGLIAQSDGGTLFLDEIGDMPLQLQTRLLRVLAEGEVMPIGAEKAIPIDLTVVSASHRDLRRLIAEGVFREDLYYRLAAASLFIPALRERSDKEYVIRRILEEEGDRLELSPEVSPRALEALANYEWPGNVRQLRNVLRFALAICDDGYIDACHLPEDLSTDNHALPNMRKAIPMTALGLDIPNKNETITVEYESDAQTLLGALRRHRWNITAVSEEMKICRSTVYRQMKRYRIVQPNHS
ncbi:MAG: sigma-54-dependent Fis family transcriptional regulator [Rhodocyclaceae bacterium]|nr:MAG: sigma-54-dependent Fis family transcriptional regulator [Rhodocyclaceae bacterium]